MRIMLFPKLIRDENCEMRILQNGRLVIDGQNFFYSCYSDSKLPYKFGPEANGYAKYIKKLLYMFINSNIECYFVFKGGDTDIDKKLNNLKAKFESQPTELNVAPIFIKEIHKQVLEEVGVKFATCMFECKEDCVALAKALKCPVLSNDIEFCFKGAPYIPSTTLSYNPQTKRLTCKQYRVEAFLKKHSLTNKHLAIFAALSDTTVFEQNYFNNLLRTWDVLDSNLYLQLKKLLKWLSEHTEEEVLNSILKFITEEDDKQKFLKQITKLSKTNNNSDFVTNYLMKAGDGNGKDLPMSLRDPKWFEKGVVTQRIPVRYINLYTNKLILGSWVDIGQKTANDNLLLSLDIIKYAYNLLTNFKLTDFFVHNTYDGIVKINTEYENRKPLYKCYETVFENGWKNIKRLQLFEHFLTTNGINITVLNELPGEARMLFITLAYFARKKSSMNLTVTREVYCFIVSYVLLFVAFDKINSFRKLKSGISEDDSVTVTRVTKKYFTCNVVDVIDEKALNTLTELQYCLLHMNYLNTLCGSRYITTKYHRTFNGTFIYQLFKDMEDTDGKEFIAKLFKTAPTVLIFVDKLIASYKKL